jgi:hypothetical protein
VGWLFDRLDARVGGPRRPPERPNTTQSLVLLNKISSQAALDASILRPGPSDLINSLLSYPLSGPII